MQTMDKSKIGQIIDWVGIVWRVVDVTHIRQVQLEMVNDADHRAVLVSLDMEAPDL